VKARLRDAAHDRLWPLGLVLFGLALASVLTNAPGKLVGDNQFALYWSPGTLLRAQVSIWQGDQGLGRFSLYFWPVTTGVLASLRAIGLSPWLTERLWHASLLATGGIGMVAVLRLFRPRIGLEHLIAGLFYTFSPFTAAFLVPSNLFLAYALSPWMLFAFVRGVRDEQPARWAAVFALLVFADGNINYPTVFFAVLPVVPIALYLLFVDGSVRWRSIGRWALRATVLVLMVSAAGLVVSHLSSSNLGENLVSTETPRQIAQNSSWAESWRGLGFWLVYYSDRIGRVVPELSGYFRWPVVLATFAIPCSALASLWLLRWRPRLVFAGTMLLGVAIMVSAFPVESPSPYGHALLDLFAHVRALLALRNSYKAGPLLGIGTAGLLGTGAARLIHAVRAWRPRLAAPSGFAVFGVLAIAAFPFWTGRLYAPTGQMTQPPAYWLAAARWLNHQSGDGRVLVLPATVDATYRWGGTTEDIVDGLIQGDRIARSQISLFDGTKESANLVDALDNYLESGDYQAGTFAPIARRLGIRYVLIRNDLEWQTTGRPRPASFDSLRNDPDVRLARQFGMPGQNVTASRATPINPITREPNEIAGERRLSPVEIYEVRGPTQEQRAVSAPSLLVSGDGNAWSALAAAGLLDNNGPVQYTGALAPTDLLTNLRDGSEIVISDTNRKRSSDIPERDATGGYSYTLTQGESAGQSSASLFGRASQTIATYPGAERITASGYGGLFPPAEPAFRPSNAFDGDLSTVWRAASSAASGAGQWIRVTLRHPVAVSEMKLVAAPAPAGQPRILHATISFSEGKPVPVDLTAGGADLKFSSRETRYVQVRIDKVAGRGFVPPGFAEITIPGVDLREFIQTPDDVFRLANQHPALSAALARAPIAYLFDALAPSATNPVEPHLNRRFRTVGNRGYELSGTTGSRTSSSKTVPGVTSGGTGCVSGILQVDGRDVPVRFLENPTSSVSAQRARFVSCGPLELGPGWHTLTSERGTTLATVSLTAGVQPPARPAPQLVTLSRGRDHVDGRSTTPTQAAVIIGQSFDPTWRATIDGHDAGTPVSLDTLTGWRIGSGRHTIHAYVSAQRPYVVSLVVTGVGVILCLWLVVRRRGQRR
jgi:arabinofuranan 3-O-arabinosyltransferase